MRRMYRDDVCAVCGESLPPDHFYCREHAATVDDRLHEIGALLPRVAADAARLARLLGEVAGETWDYLAESEPDDPVWPPAPALTVVADAEDIDVDVDSEPGMVRVDLRVSAGVILSALAGALDDPAFTALSEACASAEGANATH
jgi:hypothetical protein